MNSPWPQPPCLRRSCPPPEHGDGRCQLRAIESVCRGLGFAAAPASVRSRDPPNFALTSERGPTSTRQAVAGCRPCHASTAGALALAHAQSAVPPSSAPPPPLVLLPTVALCCKAPCALHAARPCQQRKGDPLPSFADRPVRQAHQPSSWQHQAPRVPHLSPARFDLCRPGPAATSSGRGRRRQSLRHPCEQSSGLLPVLSSLSAGRLFCFCLVATQGAKTRA